MRRIADMPNTFLMQQFRHVDECFKHIEQKLALGHDRRHFPQHLVVAHELPRLYDVESYYLIALHDWSEMQLMLLSNCAVLFTFALQTFAECDVVNQRLVNFNSRLVFVTIL